MEILDKNNITKQMDATRMSYLERGLAQIGPVVSRFESGMVY